MIWKQDRINVAEGLEQELHFNSVRNTRHLGITFLHTTNSVPSGGPQCKTCFKALCHVISCFDCAQTVCSLLAKCYRAQCGVPVFSWGPHLLYSPLLRTQIMKMLVALSTLVLILPSVGVYANSSFYHRESLNGLLLNLVHTPLEASSYLQF